MLLSTLSAPVGLPAPHRAFTNAIGGQRPYQRAYGGRQGHGSVSIQCVTVQKSQDSPRKSSTEREVTITLQNEGK